MTPERALAALGGAATALGLALSVVPAPAVRSPVAFVVLAVLGGALAVLAAGVALGEADTSLAPAGDDGAAVPGDEFDRALASVSFGDSGAETRAAVRERLRRAAVRELGDETALAGGEWTDDPAAAAFFRGDDPTRRERLRALLRGDPPFARRARRVVAALTGDDDG